MCNYSNRLLVILVSGVNDMVNHKSLYGLIILWCIGSGASANDCFVQKLTVARHVDTEISAQVVDQILEDASNLLKNKGTDEDYECCVHFVRSGAISVFGQLGDGLNSVDNISDIRNIFHQSNDQIKIITKLQVPKHLRIFGEPTDLGGITYPGHSLIVESSAQPDMWVHEYGHYKNIWIHRDDPNSIMHDPSGVQGVINEEDCKLMQRGGERFTGTYTEGIPSSPFNPAVN